MFLYKNTLAGFREDVDTNMIAGLVELSFERELGRRVSPNEKRSWANSLSYMERVVRRADLDPTCGLLIEYVMPATSQRIDFFISGHDDQGNKNFVIVELKQWESAEETEKDGIVKTFVGGGVRETTHPSYQANSYRLYLEDYNENIGSKNLSAHSCAYLHNYVQQSPEPLLADAYSSYTEASPIYFKDDQGKLEAFLKKYVSKGNGEEILYEVENGRIRPSKKLIDHVSEMFKGNKDFVLLDEQKVAFETAKQVALTNKAKAVVIIKGGPGTGKSVISMNLLTSLLKKETNTIFVAPNASFRDVLMHKLAQGNGKGRIQALFKGSGSFLDIEQNTFDTVVVDEAHRLKNSGAYMYKGENQVEDIVKAARTSIFFVDDNQVIRPDDIGSIAEVRRVAAQEGASVYEIELHAQFRCSGAQGYMNWLDDVLHIRETANFDGWYKHKFEYKIFDDPRELIAEIKKKAEGGKTARVVAGYAWDWSSEKEGNADAGCNDIVIPEYDFSMPWNSRRIGTTWAIDLDGVNQAGCIHTSQGLEFDYVGVIVGKDLQYNPETMEFFTDWKEYKDKNGKKGLKDDPKRLNKLVRNIYKVLMSRGMKGCYVYFADPEVKKYFESRLR